MSDARKGLHNLLKRDAKHAEESTKRRANTEPTPKDYTDYLRGLIKELEISIEHHGDRLHALEEKERTRARDEHERDVG